jgi:rhodanese-related sulfurtransferase
MSTMETTTSVAPRRLAELLNADPSLDLIDVRTPAEFGEVHIPEARNLPLDKLEGETLQRLCQAATQRTLYLVCKAGGRGQKACEKLASAGARSICNVEGGTQAWVDAGLPVVRGKKAISLERQVRIAAGSLVLLGVLLAWRVHPAFMGLSAFVGAGLVFAGITDTCGMGMMLSKMPWNQACGSDEKNCSK